MARKIRFFLYGLIPGLVILFFIFNQKGATCSGYLPNSRVIAETNSKTFSFSDAFSGQMKQYNIDETTFKEKIFSKGEINFSKSEARRTPCPRYLMNSETEYGNFEIQFEKCDTIAVFHHFVKR